MADRIKGITIEIGGDTTKLQSALKQVNSASKSTAAALRDVNNLLKFNPGNTELLRQKQQLLGSQIKNTKEKLDELKRAQEQMDAAGVDKTSEQYMALQREIIDTEGYLKNLEKEMKQFGSVGAQQVAAVGGKMKELGGKVEEAGRKLRGISAAAAGALTGLLGLGYKAVQNADDLNTMAKQTGFTTAELQKMQYAADLVDVSLEDITQAARKMKTKMDPANETFQRLGISVTGTNDELRDVNEVFYEAIGALSGIENETERDQIAMELFGKSADQLAGIIDDGGAAFKEYGKQAEDLGLILSQDTLDALNETNDTVDQLKANISGSLGKIGADIASVLAPALERASEVIGSITEKIRNLTPEQQATILKILAIVAAISPLLMILGNLITMIGALLTFAPAIAAAIAAINWPLVAVIAAVVAFIAIIKLLQKVWEQHGEEIKAKAQEIWQSVTGWFQQLGQNIQTIWQNIRNTIATAIYNAKTRVQNTVNNIKTDVQNAFNSIKTTAQNVWNGIRDAITRPIESAKNTLSRIVSGIAGIFNGLASAIRLPSIQMSSVVIGGHELQYPRLVWNARAMKNAVMLDGATIFGAMNGNLYGGGERGREIIVSYDKLAQMIGGGTTNVSIVVNASPGMSESLLADAVARKLQQTLNSRRAVWGN